MLNYKTQYHVLAGIFYSFNSLSKKRSFSVSHSENKIEKMKIFYKPSKYETSTKENFIIYCLYTATFKNITSLHEMMEVLSSYSEEDIKNIIEFKNDIVNYRRHLVTDVQTIVERYNKSSNYENIIDMYFKNKIRWYTMYMYCVYSESLETVKKTRRYSKLFKKLELLFVYITLNQKTLGIIKETL